MRRAQNPDHSETWHGSWERLSDKVHAFLVRRVGGVRLPYDVEFDDFFSGVLARMLRDLPQLEVRGREEFWGWVKTIAAHQLTDLWRVHGRLKRGAGQLTQQVDDDEVDIIASARDPRGTTPSGIFQFRELEAAEEECLAKLSQERQRELYLLRRKLGLSFEEIADRIGGSADATRAAFNRIKDKVQQCLRARLDGCGDVITEP